MTELLHPDPGLIDEKVTAFLQRHTRKAALGAEEDVFAAGYVNSLFALQLIQFVERAFGIRVEDQDLDIDNFRSAAAIRGFVLRKRQEASVRA